MLIHSLYVNVFTLFLFVLSAMAGMAATAQQDSESTRARKRLRIDSPHQLPSSLPDQSEIQAVANMRYSESDQDSFISVSPDYDSRVVTTSSPSSAGMSLGHPGPSSSTNGYSSNVISMNGNSSMTNGHVATMNGSTTNGIGNGIHKVHGKSVRRVSLPGTLLYDDDGSFVDREEFVRLVIQSLRDVGYA